MKKGRVLINYNICDNAAECGGIEVCPEGALFWDKEKEQITYNAAVCTDCGMCADEENGGCPVGAIRFAKNDEEYENIKKEIEEDSRKIEDLQVERYGAAPIKTSKTLIDFHNILKENDNSLVLLELHSEVVECMLYSIKIEDILKEIRSNKFLKVKLDSAKDFQDIEIEKLPALLFYNKGKLLGKIEGYYDDSMRKEFFAEIRKLIH